MLAGGLADLLAASHAGNLVHAVVALDAPNRGAGTPPAHLLLHQEVDVRERGDLRQVCNAEHLMMRGEPGQRAPHAIGGTTADPRVHFALNCASKGCPPLQAGAYLSGTLSEQLHVACRLAMNRDRWVRVDGDKVELTRIFDWYADDFEVDGGSVLMFINSYRDEALPVGTGDFSYMSYDWSLNQVQ